MRSEVRRRSISRALEKVPVKRLGEVEKLLETILAEKNTKKKKNKYVTLRGAWADKGYENIDIEKELKATREAMTDAILNRKL